jgi:hypothetical protein
MKMFLIKINKITFTPNYLLIVTIIFFISCNNVTDKTKINIRSKYKSLSIAEIKAMVKEKNFFDKYWNKHGEFENEYEELEIENKKVVLDYATNLMWHQSGSADFINPEEAAKWLADLNKSEYAGQTSWRLPTLEEALTLMENEKLNNNFYIDSVFDSWQWCILTGDSLGTGKSWLIAFSGRVDWYDSKVKINYVRPVCSVNN